MFVAQIPWLTYAVQALCGLVLYGAALVIYRLYFSPLSKFPGPKLAAATHHYEAYYDLFKGGEFAWKIRELHRQYGPIIRVNPREIHIQDPDFVDRLYFQRLDKDAWFSRSFQIPQSSFGTSSNDVHRHRRAAINPFFSKSSIASRTPIIQEKVSKLCDQLKQLHEQNEVVQFDAGVICLTADIISQFAYGISFNNLDTPGFNKDLKQQMEDAFAAGAMNRQYPFVEKTILALPMWLAVYIVPSFEGVLLWLNSVRAQAKHILDSKKLSDNSGDQRTGEDSGHEYFDTEKAGISKKATIFDQILDSKLPAEEKELERLFQEAQSLNGAGTETTGRALSVCAVHLLKQPRLLAQLRKELLTVMPEPSSSPTLQQLEHLPFLTAVIKESIRWAGSICTRMSRVSPEANPVVYKEWTIPPGTPVSLTLFDVLMDPEIFTDPEQFDPMRWLVVEAGSDGHQVLQPNTALDKYMVAFSRGPRSCVGMWLAWAEMYLTVAHVFRKFDMELYKTDIEDVAPARDLLTCFAKKGSQGVRVKITRVRDT